MKVQDKMLIKNLAHTAEIINTINGGMAQPDIKIHKDDYEWIIRVKVPGVSSDNLKIEVKDNNLLIFHIIDEKNSSEVKLPFLITMVSLHSKVNFAGIMAEHENSELFIHLPIDEETTGYDREIKIFKR